MERPLTEEASGLVDELTRSLLMKIEHGMAELLLRANAEGWWPAFVWVRYREFEDRPGVRTAGFSILAGDAAPGGNAVQVYAIPAKSDEILAACREVMARGDR